MGDGIADVCFAARGLTRAWGYTTAAVLTLALYPATLLIGQKSIRRDA
jgi:hypothetical protein